MTCTTDTTSLEQFKAGNPGVYEGIPAAVYHNSPAIGSTTLKAVHCYSPRHARHKLDNPSQPSEEMVVGAAAHCLLFTIDRMGDEFTVATNCAAGKAKTGDACGNPGKVYSSKSDLWFCGVHGKGCDNNTGGRQVLTADMFGRATCIAAAVKNHPKASEVLSHATDHELSILWEDDETGLLCKCRLDVACRGLGIFPDLKTCASAKPKRFAAQAFDLAYHVQLAHYRRGAIASGVAVDLPNIIAAENAPPHDVVVYEPSEEFMGAGIKHWRCALNTYAECKRSGEWPGYAKGILTLEPPKWAD